jgi:hypothetical protein
MAQPKFVLYFGNAKGKKMCVLRFHNMKKVH